ncbi:MAG TPA: universal stress protein [Oculatellaceae cyanobacterium]
MNILVAVDDSEFADHVADFVCAHSWPAGSHFTVLTVLPSLLPVAAALPPPILKDLERDYYIAAGELLKRIATSIKATGCSVSEKTLAGDPKHQILSVAKGIKADTIVMGSHGRSGFERMMLGSVSLAVASHAHCSVMIVRPPVLANKNTDGAKNVHRELVS